MFATISAILQAITTLVNSLVGFTKTIDNVVESSNHATNALRLHAEELEEVASFDVTKKKALRKAAVHQYKKELADLK